MNQGGKLMKKFEKPEFNIATFDVKISKNQTLFATTNSNVTLETAKAKYKADNTISKPSVKKLKANKKYFVKVRAYKTVGKSKVYGAYSAVRSCKVK